MSRFVFSLILCMTVASNQPSLALTGEVENLIVKNAQSKRADGRSIKHADSVNVKNSQHSDKNSHSSQPERKANNQASPKRVSGPVDLGFPYKATVPAMKAKVSIPNAHSMRTELDAFLSGQSSVLRGYDAR